MRIRNERVTPLRKESARNRISLISLVIVNLFKIERAKAKQFSSISNFPSQHSVIVTILTDAELQSP
jgi:hypothetical protein